MTKEQAKEIQRIGRIIETAVDRIANDINEEVWNEVAKQHLFPAGAVDWQRVAEFALILRRVRESKE